VCENSTYGTPATLKNTLRRRLLNLISEAMAYYREKRLEAKTPLTDLPLLSGQRLVQELPTRDELYNEIFSQTSTSKCQLGFSSK
jgi:hypothetical protein